jgi:hypothetical protein
MSTGNSPLPRFARETGSAVPERPPLGVRIRTRWRRAKLDDELARAVDPSSSAELTLRAGQLTSPEGRTKLANTLLERLGSARAPYLGAFRKKLRRRDDAIRKAADDLSALVRRLRDVHPVDVRGAAMTARLLKDRSSPLNRGGEAELRHAVRAALVALDVTGRDAPDLASTR